MTLTMTRKLSIFQASVGKVKDYHAAALATAWEQKFDIMLIQEPHFYKDIQPPSPVTNSGFNTYTPITSYEEGNPDVSLM